MTPIAPMAPPPLSASEADELRTLETTIQRVLPGGLEIGPALIRIRDQKLHRNLKREFEDYCYQRLGIPRTKAGEHIEAVRVVDNLAANACILPTNVAQVRPLLKLPADEQVAAWNEAVETAPYGRITVTHVSRVVRERRRVKSGKPRKEPANESPEIRQYEKAKKELRKLQDEVLSGKRRISRLWKLLGDGHEGLDQIQKLLQDLQGILGRSIRDVNTKIWPGCRYTEPTIGQEPPRSLGEQRTASA